MGTSILVRDQSCSSSSLHIILSFFLLPVVQHVPSNSRSPYLRLLFPCLIQRYTLLSKAISPSFAQTVPCVSDLAEYILQPRRRPYVLTSLAFLISFFLSLSPRKFMHTNWLEFPLVLAYPKRASIIPLAILLSETFISSNQRSALASTSLFPVM